MKGQSEHELNPLFEGMFFFSCIWAIGAVCDSETKEKFNLVFTELLKGDLSQDIRYLKVGALILGPFHVCFFEFFI